MNTTVSHKRLSRLTRPKAQTLWIGDDGLAREVVEVINTFEPGGSIVVWIRPGTMRLYATWLRDWYQWADKAEKQP